MSSFDPKGEKDTLEAIAADSWYAEGVAGRAVAYSARVLLRHARGGSCLELGPAEGLMTRELRTRFDDLTVVEGAEAFCAQIRAHLPDVHVVHGLFEAYAPARTFDTIVLGHVLEHVIEPQALLRRIAGWLAPGGVILAAVPNARSVHRQAAVIMGLLEEEHAMNEADRHHGHRRVYDPESLRAEFLRAGLAVEHFGGYWLKPLSNGQLDAGWTPEMTDAFFRLGERYPDVAAEIYVAATRRTP